MKYSSGEIFIKFFPWKDLLLSFLIPKAIYHFLAYIHHSLEGVILSLLWCVVVMVWNYVKTKEIDFIAIVSMVMIGLRYTSFLFSQNPTWKNFAPALDNFVFGTVFLISLLAPKPLLESIVEKIDISTFSEELRKSPFYRKAWLWVTGFWGITNILASIIIFLMAKYKNPTLSTIDWWLGFPLTLALIIFSMHFPRWYWKVHKDEIFT